MRRGADRFRTVTTGIESRPSFSYGAHYDPNNLGFEALMVHNEDRLDPGAGYDRHAHRGVDIVTWVIDGTLEHEHWIDGRAHREPLTTGCLQVLRTGGGVDHAEHAAGAGSAETGDAGAHYVQMWVRSGRPDARPEYARMDADRALGEPQPGGPTRWFTLATGRPRAAGQDGVLELSEPGAELAVGRLTADAQVSLSPGGPAHLFVTRGAVRVDEDPLGANEVTLAAGDALRLEGRLLQDQRRLSLTARREAEILLWRFAG